MHPVTIIANIYLALPPIQHLMKFPTIILGMPHLSRRMVNEKQQLMKHSSGGASASLSFRACFFPAPFAASFAVDEESVLRFGLYRKTQDVSTAFCDESNAIWPYLCGRRVRGFYLGQDNDGERGSKNGIRTSQ